MRWQRWIEPWYVAYGLLGAAVAGLAPMLLPLAVSVHGRSEQVGLVVAAFSLGGLTAPLWGSLADRLRLHRVLLGGGLLVAGLALAAFPYSNAFPAWLALALLASVGTAAASTVGNLFVVEAHPEAEWDERIGWLQTFYGGGQVAGLVLAGLLSEMDMRVGLPVAGALAVLGACGGWRVTRTPGARRGPRPILLHPDRHCECGPGSPQRLFHHLSAAALRRSKMAWRSPFGALLLLWFFSFGGAAACFALYPVLMQQSFGIAPRTSALAFAAAAATGLAFYSPAGRWSERFGPTCVMRWALGVRLLAFLGLLGLIAAPGTRLDWLALLAFALVVLAWAPLSVAATALAARLSPVGEGAGLGLFNGSTALAGVTGAALGGWVAGARGNGALAAMSSAGVGLGLLLALSARPAAPMAEERP